MKNPSNQLINGDPDLSSLFRTDLDPIGVRLIKNSYMYMYVVTLG